MWAELKGAAEAIAEFIKSPRLAITIAAVSAAMLFLPATWIASLSLTDVVGERRGLWGFLFLASLVYLAVLSLDKGWSWWRERVAKTAREQETLREAEAERAAEASKEAELRRKRDELLRNLTKEELQRLRAFVVEDKAAVHYATEDGVAARLVAAGILQIHVRTFDMWSGPAHNISPWAKEALLQRKDELAALPAWKRSRSTF